MVTAPVLYATSDDLFAYKEKRVLGLSANMAGGYLVFLGFAAVVWHLISDQDFSTILTFGVISQCLSYVLLALQVHQNRSAAGLSGRTLGLYLVSICLRLSSTLWLNGYLPVDRSGDHVFQVTDIISVAILCHLLWKVYGKKRRYPACDAEEERDTFPVKGLLCGCAVLASLVHPELDHFRPFDIAWTMGLYLDAVAMFPQLWVMARSGAGRVDGLTGHFIALTAFSRSLSAIFWYHGWEDVMVDEARINWPGWAIMTAHVVMLASVCDFLYYYVVTVTRHGLLQDRIVTTAYDL